MNNDDLTIAIATFKNKTDTFPKSWQGPWGIVRQRLASHAVRREKDGPLWSPTVYAPNKTRKNQNVEAVTMAVGDIDHGMTFEELAPSLEQYEYAAYSTHSHTADNPRYRVVVPLTRPVPTGEWADYGSRIREHVFGQAVDEATKDASRVYYQPSCPPETRDARFVVHHQGEVLDPYTLPPATHQSTKTEANPAGDRTAPKVPLGKEALDFVANGAPIGAQRSRGVAAIRNYLSAGYSVAETNEKIWRGLQASTQDETDPWTRDQVFDMVLDIASKPAPPLSPPGHLSQNGNRDMETKDTPKVGQLCWPEPEAITKTLKPVPALPPELIPSPFRAWAVDVAHRMVCPLDFVAVAVIVMAGSLIGAGCGIRPKRRDDWQVVPNIWGGVVGRPGSLKTPALQEALTPLSRLEAEAKAEFDESMRGFEADREVFRAQREALKDDMKAVAKDKGKGSTMADARQRLATLPEPACPTWKRYKTSDSTVEKMAEILRENPRGVLLFRDELVGILSAWDREGRESDRAFYLESWNGYGSQTSDRIGRGTIHVDNLCVSILGGIQPGKLLAYLHQASSEMENDGFIQRMQLLVYPDEPQAWRLVDEYPDAQAKQRAFRVGKALAGMQFGQCGAIQGEGDRIPYLHFDDEAQALFYEWLYELEGKLRTDEPPVLLEHLSKYRSLMPSLALIDHLVALADGTASGPVSRESAERAAAWCEYLEAHARRIYGLVGDVAQRAAAGLTKKITVGALKDGFTLRDIYNKGWFLLSTRGEAEGACDLLEDAGWLRKDDGTDAPKTAGRPSAKYRLNPKIPVNARDGVPAETAQPLSAGSEGSLSRAFGQELEG